MTLRVAFAGGGTGGHIYPALGIDDALRAAYGTAYDARYYGNRDGLEATIVRTMPLRFVPCAPLTRRFSPRLIGTVVRNAAGVVSALVQLVRDRPHVVVATGGYVCFPVMVAARIARGLRLASPRTALLEINARPGLTNRLVAPLADEIWVTYEQSRASFDTRGVVTGTPIRAALLSARSTADARRALGLDALRPTVIVMGGSQGARSINEAVIALLASRRFPPGWQLLLVAGRRDHADVAARFATAGAGAAAFVVPYLDEPADAYAAADVVVARAGASTLGELAATRCASILVPYPYAAAGHQDANAQIFANAGAARVVADGELDAPRLLAELFAVLEAGTNASMRRAAARLSPADPAARIVERITALAQPRVADSAEPKRIARD